MSAKCITHCKVLCSCEEMCAAEPVSPSSRSARAETPETWSSLVLREHGPVGRESQDCVVRTLTGESPEPDLGEGGAVKDSWKEGHVRCIFEDREELGR